MKRTVYFISMQKARSNSETYDCWAFKTEDGEYHLAYLPIDGSDMAYMCEHPTPYEEIDWPPVSTLKVFDYPFKMKLGR